MRERRQMALAKLCDAIVIRMLVTRQHPKRHVVISGLFNLARRQPPRAVSINQQLNHQRWVVRRSPAQVVFVTIHDFAQVQLIDDIADIQRQMIIAQPLAQIRRHQQALVQIVRTKCFSHGPQFTDSLISVHGFFPDRLL